MLAAKDKEYVIERLNLTVTPLERPRETLLAPFLNTTLPTELKQGHPGEVVLDAMRLCLADGWTHDPPWMWILLELVPQDPKIVEIRNRLKIKPPPPQDPLESNVLSNGAPFVNRGELRHHLKRLASTAGTAQPIFIVNGVEQSGKTYTVGYVEHFAMIQRIIATRLEFKQELEMSAKQVASDLVAMMGRPLTAIPSYETNQKLYTRQLAIWVLNEAAQAAQNQWFVLDNFRAEVLRPDTRDFLIALCDLITTGIFPHRCRLILTGFDREILTVEPEKIEEEVIGHCPVSHVEAGVCEILDRAPTPVSLPRILPYIMSGLPKGKQRMPEVNSRLRTLILAVREVREILKSLPDADYESVLVRMIEDLPSGAARLGELRRRLQDLKQSAGEV